MGSGLIAHQHVGKAKLRFSRKLRRRMTEAEAILWEKLRNRECGSFKFRRQQVISGFIADFYCNAARLAIEVDGSIHRCKENKSYDEQREKVFQSQGIRTLRFTNDQIENELAMVLVNIKLVCEARITSSNDLD